jgi:hypothetical protein
MRSLTALTMVLVLLAGQVAHAAPTREEIAEAQRRFARANKLYRDGRYQEALLLYEAAYGLVPSPDVLFNIGLTRAKVLDFVGCTLAFQEYLQGPVSAEERALAQAHLDTCRARSLVVVKVSSIPQGASITVRHGETTAFHGRTPGRLELAPGSYSVTLELPGYVTQTQALTAEVDGRGERALDFVLEKLSSLRIEADVAGAMVRIDDAPQEPAPLERELPAGKYTVVVSKPGHRDVKKEVRVDAGKQVELSIALPALPRVEDLLVVSEAGALVAVDGGAPRAAPLRLQLTAGVHQLAVDAPGFVPYRGSLTLSGSGATRVRVRLAPPRSPASRITSWSLLGLSGASLIAGGTLGVMSLRDQAAYDDAPSPALRETGMDRARSADVLMLGGLVLLVAAGAYYLWTAPPAPRVEVQR